VSSTEGTAFGYFIRVFTPDQNSNSSSKRSGTGAKQNKEVTGFLELRFVEVVGLLRPGLTSDTAPGVLPPVIACE